jgi:hypothetical protein
MKSVKTGIICLTLGALFLLVLPGLTGKPLPKSAGLSAPSVGPSSSVHTVHRVVRINQLDLAQYTSRQEYEVWSPSTCSTTAMTEVMNAYGRHYRIADVLHVQAGLHEITPELGLLEDTGIVRTVARFGFHAALHHDLSLDQIIALANSGEPVIVDFPPSQWPGGHLLVVVGGNATTVDVVDSSSLNIPSFSRARFLNLWAGFAALITPQAS